MTDKELLEQFQILTSGMTQMEERLIDRMDQKIRESETRINVNIENKITKRLDSLFEKQTVVSEKQWELERQNEKLMSLIDDLQNRVSILENRTA